LKTPEEQEYVEERAAILEYDGKMSRAEAEKRAKAEYAKAELEKKPVRSDKCDG
jgi:hypothetical protein